MAENDVEWDHLVICMLGGAECIIGESLEVEVSDDDGVLTGSFKIKNPKRIIRQQDRKGQVVSMTFVMTALDLIDEGYMEVRPVAAAAFRWLKGETLLSYLGLYVQHLHVKNAEKSNLAIPTGGSGLIHPGEAGFVHPHLRGPRG